MVEHFLGKEEVVSSILINGSKNFERCMEHSNEIKRVVSSIPITIGITVQIVRIIEIEKKQTHINQL